MCVHAVRQTVRKQCVVVGANAEETSGNFDEHTVFTELDRDVRDRPRCDFDVECDDRQARLADGNDRPELFFIREIHESFEVANGGHVEHSMRYFVHWKREPASFCDI